MPADEVVAIARLDGRTELLQARNVARWKQSVPVRRKAQHQLGTSPDAFFISLHQLSNALEGGFVINPAGALGFSSVLEEIDANGSLIFEMTILAPVYRSFRMSSLYAPN